MEYSTGGLNHCQSTLKLSKKFLCYVNTWTQLRSHTKQLPCPLRLVVYKQFQPINDDYFVAKKHYLLTKWFFFNDCLLLMEFALLMHLINFFY